MKYETRSISSSSGGSRGLVVCLGHLKVSLLAEALVRPVILNERSDFSRWVVEIRTCLRMRSTLTQFKGGVLRRRSSREIQPEKGRDVGKALRNAWAQYGCVEMVSLPVPGFRRPRIFMTNSRRGMPWKKAVADTSTLIIILPNFTVANKSRTKRPSLTHVLHRVSTSRCIRDLDCPFVCYTYRVMVWHSLYFSSRKGERESSVR